QKTLYSSIVSFIGGKFPSTTTYAAGRGSTNDEMHIFVADEDGVFTGVPGSILEPYIGVSQASDAKTADGLKNYYKDVINQQSKYIRWGAHDVAFDAAEIGTATAIGKNYANAITTVIDKSLAGGVNGTITEGDYVDAYTFF